MINCVSCIESLSRPTLTKHKPTQPKARCLGSWAYTGPGFDNEIIGKIEKDGIVKILNASMDLIWHSVEMSGVEVWVPSSKLEFETERGVYEGFDKKGGRKEAAATGVETSCMIGLRIKPDLGSHCEVILQPKSKVKVICKRDSWYQVVYQGEKKYQGWIPMSAVMEVGGLRIDTKKMKMREDRSNLTSKSPQRSILKKNINLQQKGIIKAISKNQPHKKRRVKLNSNTEVLLDFRGKTVQKATYKSQPDIKNSSKTSKKKMRLRSKAKPLMKGYKQGSETVVNQKLAKNSPFMVGFRAPQRNFSDMNTPLSKIKKNAS